jgi:hypothetical protein
MFKVTLENRFFILLVKRCHLGPETAIGNQYPEGKLNILETNSNQTIQIQMYNLIRNTYL